MNQLIDTDEDEVCIRANTLFEDGHVREFKLQCELLVQRHGELAGARDREKHEDAQVHKVGLGGVLLGLV